MRNIVIGAYFSTETLQHIARQLPGCIAFFDSHMRLVAFSAEWAKFFGCELTDIDSANAAFIQNEGCDWALYVTECNQHPQNYSHKIKLNNEAETWIELKLQPWYDDNGNNIGTVVNLEDITQQVFTESRNEKLRILLNETSEISKIGAWEYDISNNRLSWSKMTKKIHGVPEDYVPDIDSVITFYKEGNSRNKVSMNFYNAVEKGIPYNDLLQITNTSGETIWARSAGKPVYKNGKLVKIIGTFQDVDEQIKAQIKVQENEKLLQTIVDSLPLNLYIKNRNSSKTLVNKSECEFFGAKSPDELVGKTNFDLFDKKTAEKLTAEDKEVMRSLKPIIGREVELLNKNGTVSNFLVSKIPLSNENSLVQGLLGISVDITKMKKNENELHKLINVTAVQNKKLINFAHIVSHNLRSHSANFSMLLKFLVEENDPEKKTRIINMLTSASNNLMATLDDLNQVVEINTNINLDKKSVILKNQIERIEENLTTFLKKNKATLEYKSIGNESIKVIPAYLESILINLLTNAVKYKHPERNPIITISIKKDTNAGILSVSDNGIGIDLIKNKDKLFGMYKTFHNHKDARGIGLYITKNQIEAMGGKITVESMVNHGTTFKIYFYDKQQ